MGTSHGNSGSPTGASFVSTAAINMNDMTALQQSIALQQQQQQAATAAAVAAAVAGLSSAALSGSSQASQMGAAAAVGGAAASSRMQVQQIMDENKLRKYKTVMCQRMLRNATCRYGLLCDFAHDETELRRNLNQCWYYGVKCEKEMCKDKDCRFSHNDMEIMYHPHIYKTKLCQNHAKSGAGCPKKNYCSFAHGRHELRQPKFTGPTGIPGMPPGGIPNGSGPNTGPPGGSFEGSFFTQPDFVPGMPGTSTGATNGVNGMTNGGTAMNGAPPSYPSTAPAANTVVMSNGGMYDTNTMTGLVPVPLQTESSIQSITITPAMGASTGGSGMMMGHGHSLSTGSLPPMAMSPSSTSSAAAGHSAIGGNMVAAAPQHQPVTNIASMSDGEFRNATDQLKINILDIVDHISGMHFERATAEHERQRAQWAADNTKLTSFIQELFVKQAQDHDILTTSFDIQSKLLLELAEQFTTSVRRMNELRPLLEKQHQSATGIAANDRKDPLPGTPLAILSSIDDCNKIATKKLLALKDRLQPPPLPMLSMPGSLGGPMGAPHNLCHTCRVRPVDAILICGHTAVCMSCAPTLAANHSGCPVCGLTITQYGPFDNPSATPMSTSGMTPASAHHGALSAHTVHSAAGHHHNHSIDSTMNGSSLASLAVAVASSTLSPSPSSSSLVSLVNAHHHGGSSGALSSMLTPRLPLRQLQLSNSLLPSNNAAVMASNMSNTSNDNSSNDGSHGQIHHGGQHLSGNHIHGHHDDTGSTTDGEHDH